MANKVKILVLCTGNSCRSQMAEGWLRHLAGERADVFSAGVETHGLNPKAVQVMQEAGIDISHHTSDLLDRYRDQSFDYVITVCDHAREQCPWFPGEAQKLHSNFPDPARATGTEEKVLAAFRVVRDQIRDFARKFAAEQLDG